MQLKSVSKSCRDLQKHSSHSYKPGKQQRVLLYDRMANATLMSLRYTQLVNSAQLECLQHATDLLCSHLAVKSVVKLMFADNVEYSCYIATLLYFSKHDFIGLSVGVEPQVCFAVLLTIRE
jgi:hypothetical protein